MGQSPEDVLRANKPIFLSGSYAPEGHHAISQTAPKS